MLLRSSLWIFIAELRGVFCSGCNQIKGGFNLGGEGEGLPLRLDSYNCGTPFGSSSVFTLDSCN